MHQRLLKVSENEEVAGEIHVLVRPEGEIEITSSYPQDRLFYVLATLQKMILDGELETAS